jgi:hypothetical protein
LKDISDRPACVRDEHNLAGTDFAGNECNATIPMEKFKFLNENPRAALFRVVNLPDEVTFSDKFQRQDLDF